MKAYILVFKTGNIVAVFMYSLVTHLSKQQVPIYMQEGKNIRTGMVVLLPSVNTLHF